MRKPLTLFFFVAILALGVSQSSIAGKLKATLQRTTVKDTVKTTKDTVRSDKFKLKFYKKDAHASYYADKFNGRRTASGKTFNNNDYTAAHRKFPFGTKVKVTNQASGKSIIVEITDRGPFSRGREIDLTKRGFMEIAKNKGIGVMVVTIEEVVN